MRTLAVPEDLLRLLSSIAQRCAKVDASCRSDYESMMVAAGKANALLAAPGVEAVPVRVIGELLDRRLVFDGPLWKEWDHTFCIHGEKLRWQCDTCNERLNETPAPEER